MKSREIRSVCNYVNEEIECFFFFFRELGIILLFKRVACCHKPATAIFKVTLAGEGACGTAACPRKTFVGMPGIRAR